MSGYQGGLHSANAPVTELHHRVLQRGMLTLAGIDGEYELTLAFTKQLLRRQLSRLFVFDSCEEGAVLDCGERCDVPIHEVL